MAISKGCYDLALLKTKSNGPFNVVKLAPSGGHLEVGESCSCVGFGYFGEMANPSVY